MVKNKTEEKMNRSRFTLQKKTTLVQFGEKITEKYL